MADMAPQTAYQGSKDMKRVKPVRSRKASKTIIGSHKKPRVRVTQTPFGGDDLAGA